MLAELEAYISIATYWKVAPRTVSVYIKYDRESFLIFHSDSGTGKISLTLAIMRLLLSKAQGCKDF